jgi:type IV pilus assembly protein PilE
MLSKFKLRANGFGLLELMIVIAIIGILASFAYPSYQESVRKGKRGDGVASLMNAAQWMERNFSDAARYDLLPSGSAIALPAELSMVPQGASLGNEYYTISISSVSQTTFTLTATPVRSMLGDACGSFTINQNGARGLSGNTKAVEECWRR